MKKKVTVKATIELTISINAKEIVEQWWGDDWDEMVEDGWNQWGAEIEDDLKEYLEHDVEGWEPKAWQTMKPFEIKKAKLKKIG